MRPKYLNPPSPRYTVTELLPSPTSFKQWQLCDGRILPCQSLKAKYKRQKIILIEKKYPVLDHITTIVQEEL